MIQNLPRIALNFIFSVCNYFTILLPYTWFP